MLSLRILRLKNGHPFRNSFAAHCLPITPAESDRSSAAIAQVAGRILAPWFAMGGRLHGRAPYISPASACPELCANLRELRARVARLTLPHSSRRSYARYWVATERRERAELALSVTETAGTSLMRGLDGSICPVTPSGLVPRSCVAGKSASKQTLGTLKRKGRCCAGQSSGTELDFCHRRILAPFIGDD